MELNKEKTTQNYMILNILLHDTASSTLRQLFCEKWKSIYQFDWENTKSNRDIFIEGLGKNMYKNSKKLQTNLLITGNINSWDLILLIDAIRSLCSTDKNANSFYQKMYGKFDRLKKIRNDLSHQGSAGVADENFQMYWIELSDILISLGVSQKDLDDVKLCSNSNYKSNDSSVDKFSNFDNIKKADELKKKGNLFFAQEQYHEAIDTYSSAVMLSGIPTERLAILYANRSITFLKIGEFVKAKDDAKVVVNIHPTWWKGFFRLANSYENLKKYDLAAKYNELSLKLNPPATEIEKLNDLRDYCRLMLAKSKRSEHSDPQNYIKTQIADATSLKQAIAGKYGINNEDFQVTAEMTNQLGVTNALQICAEGHKFLHGIGVSQNYELAANRFAEAASKGCAEGLYNLAVLTRHGNGVQRDVRRGIELLKKAASQPPFFQLKARKSSILGNKVTNIGVKEAAHSLGLAYDEGSGVEKNKTVAFEWYSRALEYGNQTSANNIACMYRNGDIGQMTTKEKFANAILYWKLASLKGVVRAMENLVKTYFELSDISNAYNFYCLARQNGSIDLTDVEHIFSGFLPEPPFDSNIFLEELENELQNSPLKKFIITDETILVDKLKSMTTVVKNPKDVIILEHRQSFQLVKKLKGQVWKQNPANLQPRPTIDLIGLKPIMFKDMDPDKDHIYNGFAIKLTIIEDSIVGRPSVGTVAQDDEGEVRRIYVYNIPQDKDTQDKIGYGCRITIVNPYHRIAMDRKIAIRVDDPSSVIYHAALKDKHRCRYCGKPEGKLPCRHCKRAFYCSKNCLHQDASENSHRLVCCKHI